MKISEKMKNRLMEALIAAINPIHRSHRHLLVHGMRTILK